MHPSCSLLRAGTRSLFSSHIALAHNYWEQFLNPADWAIDATCGNGKDTLKLAQILTAGTVIGIDQQQLAVDRTLALLTGHQMTQVFLYQQSHETFPSLAQEHPIRLIVYNLGYLPGGDKTQTTLTPTTLKSLDAAMDLIAPGGVISITCYSGHLEGKKEEEAISIKTQLLSPQIWDICHHQWVNSPQAPSLVMMQKKQSFKIMP